MVARGPGWPIRSWPRGPVIQGSLECPAEGLACLSSAIASFAEAQAARVVPGVDRGLTPRGGGSYLLVAPRRAAHSLTHSLVNY